MSAMNAFDPFVMPTTAKKSKSSDVPIVACNPELTQKYIDAKRREEAAAVEKDLAGGEIKRLGEDARIVLSSELHRLVKTIRLDGVLDYQCRDRFTTIDMERVSDLRSAFDFDRHCVEVREYKLDAEKLRACATDPEVIAAFGILQRKGLVEFKRCIDMTEAFYFDFTTNPDVRDKAVALGIKPQAALALPRKVSA